MRSTSLLLILMSFVLLTACTEDSTETKDVQSSSVGTSDAAEYHLINGKKVRLSSSPHPHFINHDNNDLIFRAAASSFSMIFELPVDDVLRLNGWEDVAEENMPKDVSFWLNPVFDAQARFGSKP